ncbi:hypothetical protein DYD21_08180 [Rhodohalobacter sp. SW132]|uniref:hypothetical protein n=1 Tax=Rhodohalobacter sp. SW132 TaxID=2293433 RepID=UPI000E2291C5|nr:hypothetical protein [Rhodohalobacter sp. SW132]REL37749.1 hypothetical protein DYD21_08180 [Rhodohalobacter sp. SW132]
MNNKNSEISVVRPPLVSVIVIVNSIGWITTLGIWIYFHLTGKIPSVDSMNSYWERAYIGIVHGFTVADAIWSNILLLASVIGLWKMKSWGWTAALMANSIWFYSMTVTFVRDFHTMFTTGTFFFLFFAFFALFSTAYLWIKRDLFWME